MQIKKRLTGGYRLDLTRDELTHLSEALSGRVEDNEVPPRVKLLAGVMALAVKFPGVHTVKEDT